MSHRGTIIHHRSRFAIFAVTLQSEKENSVATNRTVDILLEVSFLQLNKIFEDLYFVIVLRAHEIYFINSLLCQWNWSDLILFGTNQRDSESTNP